MLLTHGALFSPVELEQRIFTKVARLLLRERLLLLAETGNAEATDQVAKQVRVRELATEGTPIPQLVVDVLGTLVSANQSARRVFDISPGDVGRALKDLDISYKPVDLRTPVERSYRDRRPVLLSAANIVLADGTSHYFDIHVMPLIDEDGSVVGTNISYVDVTAPTELRGELERSRQDVETAYEELQSSNEELETTNEELQSTVEELETTNEELQSSNEELETMNEELESTNEELQTTNAELRQRSDELNTVNAFLESILTSLRGGVAVVDADFKVLVWNDQAQDLWGMRTDEAVGRHLLGLAIGLPLADLANPIKKCLNDGDGHQSLTLSATNRRGRQFTCRVQCSAMAGSEGVRSVILLMEAVEAVPSEV